MRTTKALLCAAAIAAGAVTAMAQSNVYSLNVVGYVNLSVTNGYNLVANQLDLDGTATNNTLASVFGTNVPLGAIVVSYNGGYSSATYIGSGKWSGASNACNFAMNPGRGFYYKSPTAGNSTITMVGNVVQGTNVMSIATGYQLISSIPPLAGGLQQGLHYQPSLGDIVVQYSAVPKAFSSHTFTGGTFGTNWTAGQPTVNVGDAVWLKAAKATNWTQAFTVQ